MQGFTTPEALVLAPSTASGDFTRADLVFYGVEHRGRSYEARIYLDSPEADVDTPLSLENGFAGSFVIFGHGGCFGDEGHCELPEKARDPFDSRPPHGLTPQTKLVDVTEAVKAFAGAELTITVVPVVRGEERLFERADVLFFTELRLLTYQ